VSFSRQFYNFFHKIEDKKIRLAEEVTDCGPLVDLKKTPGCKVLEGEFDAKKDFPDCCPKFDCEEGIEIIYENKNPKEPAAIQKNPGSE